VFCVVQEVDEAAVVDSTGAFDAMLALYHLGDAVQLLQATAATAAAASAAAVDSSSGATAADDSSVALITSNGTAPAAVAAIAAAFAALDYSGSVRATDGLQGKPSVTQLTTTWRISELMSMLYTTPVSRFLKDRFIYYIDYC
jgi:hypothetical protein